MGKKYFVWSFDDGLEQDKRITETLRGFGMGATFNLNSGLWGKEQMIGRIGTLGCHEVPVERYQKEKRAFLKYVPHCRIPEDEVCQVYEGFEIASHTTVHVKLTKQTEEEMRNDILLDIKQLSDKFTQNITGFAYPFGASSEIAKKVLTEAGIKYARTVNPAKDFSFPQDPLSLGVTSWHIYPNTLKKLEVFLSCPEQEEDMLFLMFAHGYEFDFGVRESSWEKFKRICDRVMTNGNVICCSTDEAFRAHEKNNIYRK